MTVTRSQQWYFNQSISANYKSFAPDTNDTQKTTYDYIAAEFFTSNISYSGMMVKNLHLYEYDQLFWEDMYFPR